jgi:hypothetical protein
MFLGRLLHFHDMPFYCLHIEYDLDHWIWKKLKTSFVCPALDGVLA